MALVDVAARAFEAVKICKLFHNFGRLDKLNMAYTLDEDLYWQMQYEALDYITDDVFSKFNEATYEQKQYYYDAAMIEYYRLCRVYNERFQTTDDDNPYIKKALSYIRDKLDMLSGGFGADLHTKTHHSWSCRLIIYLDNECFGEYTEMAEALLYIFDFYKNEVENLKAELEKHSITEKIGTKEAA